MGESTKFKQKQTNTLIKNKKKIKNKFLLKYQYVREMIFKTK